ncbi:MAG: tetratricopeptide repeat protein [Candidatus Schekmanbacteria bacterium]|nr:tetratricopeptide repeat protein [Candidatus Schekmanbacteria bacterium]
MSGVLTRTAGLWIAVALASLGPGTAASAADLSGTLGGTSPAVAEEQWPELFHKANEAYEAGDYETAKSLYGQLIASGLENGDLWYNLGNTELRSGRHGQAIASYLRAASYMPRDGDVQANLARARESAKDALAPPQAPVVLRTVLFWYYGSSLTELVAVALIASFLFWCACVLRLRLDSEALRWAAAACAIVFAIAGGSAAARALFPRQVAVVVTPAAAVRSATSDKSVVLFELHEGAEAALEGREEGWVKIALPEEKRGWIDARQVEVGAAI